MQRSIINQRPLAAFLYIVFFTVYESLSSIYLFLPPMLAVLYVLFSRALKEEDTIFVLLVSFCLVVFEAEKGYLIFSTIIYFTLVYKFIMPKLEQNFSCNYCIKLSYVLLAYIGFFIYSLIISNIFLLPPPSIDYYVLYYMVIEFLIVSIL
jgi:hypothetical protein